MVRTAFEKYTAPTQMYDLTCNSCGATFSHFDPRRTICVFPCESVYALLNLKEW